MKSMQSFLLTNHEYVQQIASNINIASIVVHSFHKTDLNEYINFHNLIVVLKY